ncbi:YkgJ family cysteine cluster protein [Prosthecochloris sp. SCSIO W1101]|uniref:YkgJ family cysteine cluster protein n=1 Tax=Prosthecochloris sp. SCSIO W1101 TaxID=2992242 RepID=UPI00223E49B4|nr:YkgJ family cysteine cluster protein [Prosthecochloris sp. SCSIO W1101]UZJ42041.1 YkgJ family cysteine cluster protein [Prosthecochloris sp. SCSIO W1101]
MDNILNKLGLNLDEKTKLADDSIFCFGCHKELSCYNTCCGGLDIFLTPYDILRMKNRLDMTSAEFISKHTKPVIHGESKLPFLKLKLAQTGSCSFVGEEGCSIYDDRPLACRYYPIGFGVYKNDASQGSDFYFQIEEEHCRGFEEKQEQTVAEWRKKQEIDVYDDKNKVWMDLILNKKMYSPDLEPDEKSLKMFFMGSYEVDSFKSFVFESRFFDVFEVDEELQEQLRKDEEELMIFAHKWLQYALFRMPTMKLRGA